MGDLALLIVIIAGCAYGLLKPGQIWWPPEDDGE